MGKIPLVLLVACVASLQAASFMDSVLLSAVPRSLLPLTLLPLTLLPGNLLPQSLPLQSLLPQSLPLQSLLPQSLLPRSLLLQSLLPQNLPLQSLLPQSLLPQSLLPQSPLPQSRKREKLHPQVQRNLPLQQTSAAHAISPPATKGRKAELELCLCLFLLFSCLQSLPAFCSMFSIILTLTECRHISTVCCFVFLKHNFKLSDIETFLSINLKEGDYKIFSS